jgi:hypothetical protein
MRFHQEYPSFPEEAFLHTGYPVFDQRRIQELRAEAKEPAFIGDLVFV